MDISSIDAILSRVGELDDASGPETGRERFRRFLRDEIESPDVLRRLIEDCLSTRDTQHGRALQDLVVQLGAWLGFRPTFTRYEWLPGERQYAGRWVASSGQTVVLEVKAQETHAAQRPSLARALDGMVARGELSSAHPALGLYVLVDPNLPQQHLEKLIRTDPGGSTLRILSLDALFRLTELAGTGSVAEQDIFKLLEASAILADPLVELFARRARPPASESRSDGRAVDLAEIGRELGETLDWLAGCLTDLLLGTERDARRG